MSWGTGIALWGLAGLTIPIIIHFLSKRKKKEVLFGTTRFLEPLEAKSTRSIRFSEWPLLLSRLVLLSSVILLAARPLTRTIPATTAYWIATDVIPTISTLSLSDGADIHYFKIGLFGHDHDTLSLPSYYTLIDRLNADRDSSVVCSHSDRRYFRGSEIELAAHVDWHIIPYQEEEFDLAMAKKDKQTDIEIINKGKALQTISKTVDPNRQEDIDTLHIALNIKDENAKKDIEKLIIELGKLSAYEINISESNTAWMITDEYTESSTNQIRWADQSGPLRLTQIGDQHYELSGEITRDHILSSNLPIQLLDLWDRHMLDMDSYDLRSYNPPKKEVTKQIDQNTPIKQAAHPLWWLILLPLWFIERWLSYKSTES